MSCDWGLCCDVFLILLGCLGHRRIICTLGMIAGLEACVHVSSQQHRHEAYQSPHRWLQKRILASALHLLLITWVSSVQEA